jgi:hypothetical protein
LRWEQQVRRYLTQKEGRKKEHGKKLRRKTKTGGEVWLSDDHHKVEMSCKEEENYTKAIYKLKLMIK